MSKGDEIAERYFDISDFRCAMLAVEIERALDEARGTTTPPAQYLKTDHRATRKQGEDA